MKQPYLLCVDTNSQKNLIGKFLVGLRTQIEQMEWADFLHVDTDSQKFIANQKMFVLSGDFKIGFISKGNRWDKMIFFVYCYKFRKVASWFNDFWVSVVKNGHVQVYEIWNFLKLVGLIVNNMERINTKEEHSHHSLLFKVLR